MLKNLKNLFIGFIILIGMFLLCIMHLAVLIRFADFFLTWLGWFPWIVFVFNLLILLPLGFFEKTRNYAGIGMIISSVFFFLLISLEGICVTYAIWGALGVYIGLASLGIGIIPIAVLALLVNGAFCDLLALIIFLAFAYGTKLGGFYFVNKNNS